MRKQFLQSLAAALLITAGATGQSWAQSSGGDNTTLLANMRAWVTRSQTLLEATKGEPVSPTFRTSEALLTSADQYFSTRTEFSDGTIASLCDDNLNDHWHSCWQNCPATDDAPDYIAVDLGRDIESAVHFKMAKRNNYRLYPLQLHVYGAKTVDTTDPDNAEWTDLGTVDVSWGTPHYVGIADVNYSGAYRYFKLALAKNETETSDSRYMALAELNAYTTREAALGSSQTPGVGVVFTPKSETVRTSLTQAIEEAQQEITAGTPTSAKLSKLRTAYLNCVATGGVLSYRMLENNEAELAGTNYQDIVTASVPSVVRYANTTSLVTGIGTRALDGCQQLGSITLPNGIKTIRARAFYSTWALNSINWPAELTTIGDSAFDGSHLADITLPEKVTSIGRRAFYNCWGVNSLSLPASLKHIGDAAVGGLINLHHISVDEANTAYATDSINLYNAARDTILTSAVVSELTIPASVKVICYPSWGNVSTIYTQALTPPSIVRYGGGSSSLNTNFFVPGEAYGAYKKTTPWSNWKIFSNATETINGLTYSFMDDEAMVKGYETLPEDGALNIPATVTDSKGKTYRVTSIGANAFQGNQSIRTLTLPDGIRSIGQYAFNGCSFTSYNLPEGLEEVGAWAFAFVDAPNGRVNIPASLVRIGNGAFAGIHVYGYNVAEGNSHFMTDGKSIFNLAQDTIFCLSFNKYIHIPDTVKAIYGGYTFESITVTCDATTPPVFLLSTSVAYNGGTSITVPDESYEAYASAEGWKDLPLKTASSLTADGIVYRIVDGEAVVARCQSIPEDGAVTIPETIERDGTTYDVTSIGNSAFYNRDGLTSITLPEGIRSIGKHAFEDCDGLTDITLPEGIEEISDSAFYGCANLQRVALPEGLTTIGNYAFRYCSRLSEINFPDGLASIGNYAFNDCDSLQSITFGPGLEYLGECAFWDCDGLQHVTFSEGPTSIEFSTFQSCDNLQSVTLPKGLTSIGTHAFESCRKLQHVTLPEGLTSIGMEAFQNCEKLTDLTLPSTLRDIYYCAFRRCYGLKSLSLPEGMTSFAEGAFSQCRGLKEIHLPNTLKEIASYAFDYTDSLTDITIPENVTVIGTYAFNNSALKNITFTTTDSLTIYSAAYPTFPENCTVTLLDTDPTQFIGKIHLPTTHVLIVPLEALDTYRAGYPDYTIKAFSGYQMTDAGYGTFYYGTYAATVPEGLQAGVITGNDGDVLGMNYYPAGSVIPAGTPVIFKGKAGSHRLILSDSAPAISADSVVTVPADYILHGTDTETITYTDVLASYYKLSYNNDRTAVGFYWDKEGGDAFVCPAHRCYLAVPKTAAFASLRGFRLDGDDTVTGIDGIKDAKTAATAVYTLDGRRVNADQGRKLPAGLYIIGGQKVLVK